MLGWFCSSLPSGVRSLKSITISHVDAFLKAQTSRGWRRQSVRVLGGQLRIFFRYAASQGWCRPELASSIELSRIYKLADVPQAPSAKHLVTRP
jgi:site-specific recombinase XerD